MANSKVISRCRYVAVVSALEEDIDGESIGRRLRQKCNIDPLFAKSPVVIKIADNDDPQAMKTVGLRQPWELGVVDTYSVLPSIPGDAPLVTGPSYLGATSLYLPRVESHAYFLFIGTGACS